MYTNRRLFYMIIEALHKETSILTKPLILLRFILMPLDTIYHLFNKQFKVYDVLNDIYTIEDVKYSGYMFRSFAETYIDKTVKIYRTCDVITIRNQPIFEYSTKEFYNVIHPWLTDLGYSPVFKNNSHTEFHYMKDGIRVICVNEKNPYCYLHEDILGEHSLSIKTEKFYIGDTPKLLQLVDYLKGE